MHSNPQSQRPKPHHNPRLPLTGNAESADSFAAFPMPPPGGDGPNPTRPEHPVTFYPVGRPADAPIHVAITVCVPKEQRDTFITACTGPAMWDLPATWPADPEATPSPTGHQALAWHALTHQGESPTRRALVEAFRASRGRPAWMPVAFSELCEFLRGARQPDPLCTEISPLSFPRLYPIQDRAEFDAFCPGAQDGYGFWIPNPGHADGYRQGIYGIEAIFRSRHLHHAPRSKTTLAEAEDTTLHGVPCVRLLYTYSSHTAPPMGLDHLLGPVLHAHQAEAVAIWRSENGTAGWQHLRASPDRPSGAAMAGPHKDWMAPLGAYAGHAPGQWDRQAVERAAQAVAGFRPVFPL